MQHSQVIIQSLLPADQEASKAVEPTVSALDHPSTRPVPRHHPFRYSLLSSADNLGGISPRCHKLPYFRVVVSFVQAQVLPLLWGRLRPWDHCGLHCRPQKLHVMPIGSIHCHRDRDPLTLGQQAAFGTTLAAVCRIRPSTLTPPRGALVMAPSIACHSHSKPWWSSYSINPACHSLSNTPAALHC